MTINLVSLASQYVTPQLTGQIARAVGIDPAVAQKLVSGAIPAVIAAMAGAGATPVGAQKIADAAANADPDILTKLPAALQSGQTKLLSDSTNALSTMVGPQAMSAITGALAKHAGVDPAAAQAAIGAVSQAVLGTLVQQDPSNWLDGNAIASMLADQKGAISAALPPALSSMLSSAGLGGIISAADASTAGAAASTMSNATASASNAANQARSASAATGLPSWTIVLTVVVIVVIVAAIAWLILSKKDAPKPAASNPAAGHYVLRGALARSA